MWILTSPIILTLMKLHLAQSISTSPIILTLMKAQLTQSRASTATSWGSSRRNSTTSARPNITACISGVRLAWPGENTCRRLSYCLIYENGHVIPVCILLFMYIFCLHIMLHCIQHIQNNIYHMIVLDNFAFKLMSSLPMS